MKRKPVRKLEIVQPCDFNAKDAESVAAGIVRCEGCRHEVFDLSSMTRAEAEDMLSDRPADTCVFFRHDEQHRIVFKDGAGSIVGRVAKDAKPMISVAAMILAACGSGDEGESPRAEAEEGRAAVTATAAVTAAPQTAPTVSPAVAHTAVEGETCGPGGDPIVVATAKPEPREEPMLAGKVGPSPTAVLAGMIAPPPPPKRK